MAPLIISLCTTAGYNVGGGTMCFMTKSEKMDVSLEQFANIVDGSVTWSPIWFPALHREQQDTM